MRTFAAALALLLSAQEFRAFLDAHLPSPFRYETVLDCNGDGFPDVSFLARSSNTLEFGLMLSP